MAERLTEYDSHGDLYVKNHDYISASHKLAQYEDLGFTPEEIVLLAKFYREHTSVPSITAEMKMVANSIELQKYKDLDEQGRLLELPCAVDDTVYCLAQYAVKGELAGNFFVNEIQISSFEFDGDLYMYDLRGIGYMLDDIFLTKEEAEEKLKERGEQE